MKRSLFAIVAVVAVCLTLSCSNDNEDGTNLGPDGRPRANFSPEPLDVNGVRGDISSISAGSAHTCAIVTDEVWCWGAEFGNPAQVPGITGKIAELVSGDGFSCALAQGVVWCWGKNHFGQLGRGTVSDREATPAPVKGLSGVTSLAAKAEQACAVSAGAVSCWGNKARLGYANPPESAAEAWSSPVLLRELSRVDVVSVGSHHGCASAGKEVYCWGDNKFGQLGIEAEAQDADDFKAVDGLPSFENTRRSLASGADHTCLLQRAEAVAWAFCWGKNDQGQLGQAEAGSGISFSKTALDVGIHDLNFLTAGRNHTCAIDGNLMCWGDNSFGQIGATDKPISHSPAIVAGLNGTVTAISSGEDHSCVVIDRNRVKCWGSNQDHQLGR